MSVTNHPGGVGGTESQEIVQSSKAMVSQPPTIPHISENFIPLSVVVTKLVENTYTDLVNLLDTLPASNDFTKKRKLFTFLIHARQQFIKLLVLGQWAKSAKDISKVIDVVAWLNGQANCFSNAVMQLQMVKHGLGGARLRNPDIATALEVLVVGEPRLSTFNFIPPKPLTPRQILDALHDLNVLLSLRLSSSKGLPPQFRKFKIADGRATFTVDGEFEVDLGIASEEPNAQFFLIEFRFIFKPESTVTPAIRMTLERVGNEILATKGMRELYDYLHNFTLSYKLLILNQQFGKLASGIWAGTLSITHFPERQVIVINYWTELPGRKSVAEFGILQARVLGVRWLPRDFPHETFSIDQDDISAQKALSQMLIVHIQQLLHTIYTVFTASPIHSVLPNLIVPVDDLKLRIELTPSSTTYLTVEHLTGRMILQGSTDLIQSAEKTLNAQTDLNLAPQILCNLRHLSVQREIEDFAKAADWEIVKVSNIRAEDIRQKYGTGVRQITTIRQRDWIPAWFVVVTISDSAVNLWLTELQPADSGWRIAFNEAIDGAALEILYSAEKLAELATLASARITFHVIASCMEERKVSYELIRPSSKSSSELGYTSLQFDFSSVAKLSWARSIFKLDFIPAASPSEKSTVIVTGSMEPSAALKSVSASSSDVEIDLVNGKFSLKFSVPPASEVLNLMLDRLGRIERAVNFIRTLESYALEVQEVSLSRISFVYAPGLTMVISIDAEARMMLSLDKNSPHRRIQFFLQDVLDNDGLKPLIVLLNATLPILKAASMIDAGEVYFLPRSARKFRIVYQQQKHAIDIYLRDKNQRKMAYISDASSSGEAGSAYQRAEKCNGIWNTSSAGVVGLEVGVACEIATAEEVLMRIHKAIMS
ncbi:mediator complex subunit MED14-domain-containing protein [Myxozyma melibiosi]|uniref:Mediator of RNA polymerase II transcription subunit 14 n=1 Tax=Myxozyma melibiosi TaxID=54550 RepID=A0ABR1F578_9ASCO